MRYKHSTDAAGYCCLWAKTSPCAPSLKILARAASYWPVAPTAVFLIAIIFIPLFASSFVAAVNYLTAASDCCFNELITSAIGRVWLHRSRWLRIWAGPGQGRLSRHVSHPLVHPVCLVAGRGQNYRLFEVASCFFDDLLAELIIVLWGWAVGDCVLWSWLWHSYSSSSATADWYGCYYEAGAYPRQTAYETRLWRLATLFPPLLAGEIQTRIESCFHWSLGEPSPRGFYYYPWNLLAHYLKYS